VSTAFLSALMAKTVTVGCCFGEKYFDGEKGRFAEGFAIFWCFVVVKTW
jgi:hypothetical protein